METGIVGLETVQIDRIACWCSVDGPLLNEHPLEATPCICPNSNKATDRKKRIEVYLVWHALNFEHPVLAQLLLNSSCYCVAVLIRIEMRDGIFSFYIRSDETAIRAIAIVENDSIRGFNRSHIYSVERLEYSPDRLQKKDRNTNWRVKAMEHTRTEGVSVRGLPARLEGEEGEEQFWFEGGSDADKRIRVEIQGAWLQDLPWHRAAHIQK
jgi:hypothetical protein